MFFISLRGRMKMPDLQSVWHNRSSLRAQIVIVFHLNQTHSRVACLTEFFTQTITHSQQQVFKLHFQMSPGPPSLLWRKVDHQRARAPSPRVHPPCHLSWLAPMLTDFIEKVTFEGLVSETGTEADWAHLGRCLLGIRKECLPVFCLLYILPITHC